MSSTAPSGGMRRLAGVLTASLVAFLLVIPLLATGDTAPREDATGAPIAEPAADDPPTPLGTELIERLENRRILVPPGKFAFIRMDRGNATLVDWRDPDPLAGMPPAIVSAVQRAPEWIQPNLSRKFEYLSDVDITYPSVNTRPVFGDVDGDGDRDLVVGRGTTLDLYENVDPAYHYYEGYDYTIAAVFVLDSAALAGISVPSGPADPALGDVDLDGDADLLVGGGDGLVRYFRRDGASWSNQGVLAGVGVSANSAPELGDLDGDNDPDLVVGALDGLLYYYRNDGGAWNFVSTIGTDVGTNSNPALGDLSEDDGDLDLVVGDGGGLLSYFRNDGDRFNPSWMPLGTFWFSGIDAGTSAAPLIADLDLDFDLDLAIGSSDGTVHYYENQGNAALPSFLIWQRWNWRRPSQGGQGFDFFSPGTYFPEHSLIRLRHRQPSSRVLQYADIINTVPPRMVDEVAFSIATSSTQTLLNVYQNPELYRNNTDTLYYNDRFIEYANILDNNLGTPQQWSTVEYWMWENGTRVRYEQPMWVYYWFVVHPKITDEMPVLLDPTVFASGHADDDNMDTIVDTDATVDDGFGVGPSFWRWTIMNVNDTSYPSTTSTGVLYLEPKSAPALGDLDGDMDNDLVVGEFYGRFQVYRNDGGGVWTSLGLLRDPSNAVLDVGEYSAPALADFDGDGDPDLVSGSQNGPLSYFENTALGFVRDPAPFAFPSPTPGMWSVPAKADLNDDGLLDLVVGMRDGYLWWYPNAGSAGAPFFPVANRMENSIGQPIQRSRSAPALLDYDNDADLDLLVGQFWWNGPAQLDDGNVSYYRNVGTPSSPVWEHMGNIPDVNGNLVRGYNVRRSWVRLDTKPTAADVSGDGLLDLVIGGAYGNLTVYRNVGVLGAPVWTKDFTLLSQSQVTFPGAPPNLKDALMGIDVLWNDTAWASPEELGSSYFSHGIGRAMNWVQQNVPLRSGGDDTEDNNRPRQPARIQFEHNGRSGELEDLVIAAMRTALIPSYGIDGLCCDHEWENFWHKWWRHQDNYYTFSASIIDMGEVHKTWNRDWTGLIEYRGDTRTLNNINKTTALEDHTGEGGADRANVTVIVTDLNGNPVDGAKISVGDWSPYWGSALGGFLGCPNTPDGLMCRVGTQAFYTNADGIAYFTTSETRQGDSFSQGLLLHVESKFGSGWVNPTATYADRLIFNVPGITGNQPMYTFTFNVPQFLSVPLPPDPMPPSPDRFRIEASWNVEYSFQHLPNAWCYDECNIDAGWYYESNPSQRRINREHPTYYEHDYMGQGHVDVFLLNSFFFNQFRKGLPAVGLNVTLNLQRGSLRQDVPDGDDWYLVVSNRDALETFRGVVLNLRLWDTQSAQATYLRTFGAGDIGRRLMSLPVLPADRSVGSVLAGLGGNHGNLFAFDTADALDPWKRHVPGGPRNDLTELRDEIGFWIDITGPGTIEITGPSPTGRTIDLAAGWNLVGFPSFATTYTVDALKAATGATRVQGLDPAPPFYLRSLADTEPLGTGQGYWVYVPAATAWSVPP